MTTHDATARIPAPVPAPQTDPLADPLTDRVPDPVAAPAARLPMRPPPAAQLSVEPQSPLRIHGFLQNQTGVFLSTEKNRVDADRYPLDHGDKLGRLSILRNSSFFGPSPVQLTGRVGADGS